MKTCALQSQIEKLIEAVENDVHTRISANMCQTPRDYEKSRDARNAREELQDQLWRELRSKTEAPTNTPLSELHWRFKHRVERQLLIFERGSEEHEKMTTINDLLRIIGKFL